MFENISVRFIKHRDISDKLLEKIILLKKEHWNYTYEEHSVWISQNVKSNEMHVLMFFDEQVVGYLNLVNRTMRTKTQNIKVVGVGNVCVSKSISNLGCGKLLMAATNSYLNINNLTGILFCKEHLIEFYSKVGWNKCDGFIKSLDNKHIAYPFFAYNGRFYDAHLVGSLF